MGPQGLHFMLPLLHKLYEENSFPLESPVQHKRSGVCFACTATQDCYQPSSWDYLNGMQSPRYIVFKTTLWLCAKATSFFLYRRGKGDRTEMRFRPSSSQICGSKPSWMKHTASIFSLRSVQCLPVRLTTAMPSKQETIQVLTIKQNISLKLRGLSTPCCREQPQSETKTPEKKEMLFENYSNKNRLPAFCLC